MRIIVVLIIGLAAGLGGGWIFSQQYAAHSAPAATIPDPRIAAVEKDLAEARARISELEAAARRPVIAPDNVGKTAETDEAPKPGDPVDLNAVMKDAKPLLQRLSPFLDNMRRQGTKAFADQKIAELTKKYNLTAAQQDAVRKWFADKSEKDADRMKEMMAQGDLSVEKMMRAGRGGQRPDDGLDEFMAQTLTGDQLANYQAGRMQERATGVEKQANARLEQINSAVQLDESQKDQVFGILARSSKDYDPAMKLEGLGSDTGVISDGQSRDDAIRAVLTPDQQQKYDDSRQKRADQMAEGMKAMGLNLGNPGFRRGK